MLRTLIIIWALWLMIYQAWCKAAEDNQQAPFILIYWVLWLIANHYYPVIEF